VRWVLVLAPSSACLLTIDESLIDGAGDAGEVTCPADMITVGPRCIERYEVTNASYVAFVSARSDDVSGQALECSANSTFIPDVEEWPPGLPLQDRPIADVDWCDALAYCRDRGRSLCSAEAWSRACAGPEGRAYPYGASYDESACNGSSIGGPMRPSAIGEHAGCEGGFAGLFDLSGNVEEWIDDCAGEECAARGGSFADSNQALACSASRSALRLAAAPTRGFRCCLP
jgi:formylglycine-generating enzyme required for sulfatase activity